MEEERKEEGRQEERKEGKEEGPRRREEEAAEGCRDRGGIPMRAVDNWRTLFRW